MRRPDRSTTEISSWLEWKDRCALHLCGPEAQAQLAAYGGPAIRRLLKTADPDLDPGLSGADGNGPQSELRHWHLFEAYMHTGSRTTSKRWKDWLFERAACSGSERSAALEKVAYCCMRTAVRSFCEKEGHAKERRKGQRHVSLDQPDGHGERLTYNGADPLSLMVTPEDEAALAQLKELADGWARSRFDAINPTLRVAMLATALNLSLALPEVAAAANCKKTKLYEARTAIPQTVAEIRKCLESEYPKDDPETRELLVRMVIQSLFELCVAAGRAEKSCAALFILSERPNG